MQAGRPPIVNGAMEERMRVGCGSATIGMFAKQWHGKVDEVVVVDDHITGVLSEHQAGKLLDIRRHRHQDERDVVRRRDVISRLPSREQDGVAPRSPIRCPCSVRSIRKEARPGLTMLMVSTTGEHAAYYVLDDALRPIENGHAALI